MTVSSVCTYPIFIHSTKKPKSACILSLSRVVHSSVIPSGDSGRSFVRSFIALSAKCTPALRPRSAPVSVERAGERPVPLRRGRRRRRTHPLRFCTHIDRRRRDARGPLTDSDDDDTRAPPESHSSWSPSSSTSRTRLCLAQSRSACLPLTPPSYTDSKSKIPSNLLKAS